MKLARFLLPVLVLVSFTARAADPEFPGLKAIMSDADWQRAKLDRLDPADVRLINEAFVRYLKEGTAPQREAAVPQREAAVQQREAAVQQREAAVQQHEAVAVSEKVSPPEKKRSLWARFGLPALPGTQPHERPVMHAKVLAWQGTNGFVLDNAQVWQALDPIRDELVGREIGIMEGRFGSFLLVVDGVETTVRLHRLK